MPSQDELIKTVESDQIVILQNIMKLFCPEGFECDPTYSKGNFYKGGLIPQPKYKFDLAPQVDGVIQADCRNIPLPIDSINSLIFDPPFVGASIKDGKTGIIKDRFGFMRKVTDLWGMYKEALLEFHRVLKPNGVLVFKCQDVVEDHKNFFSHCQIMKDAIQAGFYPKDLFILTAENRIIQHNLKKQEHARKYHSYFWVFIKQECKVPYV